MALTDLKVRRISPRGERFEVADSGGLWLRVTPTGTRSWVYRYRFNGLRKRITLGLYAGSPLPSLPESAPVDMIPFLSLAEAREKRVEVAGKIRRGIDPAIERKDAKLARKSTPTFKELVKEFWEVELSKKKSGRETLRLMEKDTVPAWGNRKVFEIKRRNIVLLLDGIRERGDVVANRVHGALTRLFNFAAERGIIEDSPCTRIRKTKENGRTRVLSDEEIKLLWGALSFENKAVNIYRVSKLALKMILVTGQRPGEVCGMTWGEVGEDGFWTIPAERMKGRKPHRVPLTDMAREIVEAARPYSRGDLVFQSSFKDAGVTVRALSEALLRHWKEIGFQEPFTPHDLRRTLRTKLAELGETDVIAERVLGHSLQGVLAVYNQHPYDQEKRAALEKWEARLKEIIDAPAAKNVIPIRGRRHA